MDERANGLVSKREPQRAHATGSARSVLQRASDFASPHFGTPVFPREFVGCSVPVLSAAKPKVFPGFFAFLANCFGFPARPCTCMLAGAASSSALPCLLVSRPVSRQSRLRTFVFTGKTCCFVAEGVGFELGEFES